MRFSGLSCGGDASSPILTEPRPAGTKHRDTSAAIFSAPKNLARMSRPHGGFHVLYLARAFWL
jgi:hypothetical protein